MTISAAGRLIPMVLGALALVGCASVGDDFDRGWTVYANETRGWAIAPQRRAGIRFVHLIHPQASDHPSRNVYYNDEGGLLVDCSSSCWRCVSAGMVMAVPEDMTLHSWTFEGAECTQEVEGAIYRITCLQPPFVPVTFQ